MLILTRKTDEAIMIDDHIVVTILNIQGQNVKIGIEAPKSVPIHREEIYQRIQAQTETDDVVSD